MNKKYQWLEVMRGFAAIWVLLHHADLTTKAFHGDIGSIFLSRGLLGVDFFFILSGFIIAFSVSRMVENNRGIKEYFLARFLRIYLPYLPIGIGLFLVYLLFPGVSASDRDVGLLTSFTLFPTDKAPALSVAWTLQHELLFYTLFSFMFLSRAIGVVVLTIWFAFVFASYFMGINYISSILNVAANPLNLWFLVGILIFSAPSISLNPRIWTLFFVALSLGLYVFTVLGFSRIYIGIILASMVYLMTKIDNIAPKPSRAFMLLGTASYSVYLVHNPIQSIIARVPPMIGIDLSVSLFYVAITISSLAAGIAYYFLIESRAVTWSKIFIKKCATKFETASKLKEAEDVSPV